MRRWLRLLAVVAVSVIGDGSAYYLLSNPTTPRFALAFSGLLGLAGAAATVFLIALLVVTIITDLRPTLRFRRPVVPIALTQREPSMVGERRQRSHPIRFWGVLTFNNRFLFGFMLFDQPTYETFPKPADALAPSPSPVCSRGVL